MRIVHLSDIHLSEPNLKDFQLFYLPTLISKLSELNSEKKIDLVAITGDLVDKGGCSLNKPYDIFEKTFLKKLYDDLKLDKHHIVFVPGNHDIDENLIEEVTEEGLKTICNSVDKIDKFIDDHRKGDHDAIKRQKAYKQFEKRYFSKFKDSYHSNFESCYIFSINNKNIGIACINSSWRHSKDLNPNNLVLGSRQIFYANEFFAKYNCDYKIALLHHPLDIISQIERGDLTSTLQNSDYLMVLFGHTHKQDTIYKLGNIGNIFTTTARTAFSNPREKIETYKSGFTIIDINLDEYKVLLTYFRYYYERSCFDLDLSEAEAGKYERELILTGNKAKFLEYYKINNKTLDVLKEEINSSLVISGTDSIAPKTVNDIFVLPKLSDTPFIYNPDTVSKSKYYKLKDVIESKDNILFFGMKEIGKSTLLHRIFLEIAENYPKYGYIPIYINYLELRNKKVRSVISRYLMEELKTVDELLQENKIILLIDDIEENDDTEYERKSILEFNELYPKIKIIGTTTDKYEMLISASKNIINDLNFKCIFIGEVSVKEFKELSNKWFHKNNSQWLKDNLEKLIKVFEILRIPKTFFSISLFLWIIEKQENFTPVNKANLVSSFLQFILEGLKKENIDAGSYNYNKKIVLLTEIAYRMYKEGDKNNNYCISKIILINYIQEDFNLNQRKWNAEEKFNEFIERGILKVDLSLNVRFRFECFFEYFLSLNINNNEEFKKEVFQDDNFLSFIEEIDFYTAQNSSAKDNLLWIMKHLESAFSKLDSFIQGNVDDYLPHESILLKGMDIDKHLPEIKKNKLQEEELEEIIDTQLEKIPVAENIKTKLSYDKKVHFYLVLELSARILKNSENIKEPDLINNSIETILNKSAKYSVYLQSEAIVNIHKKYLKDNTGGRIPIEEFVILVYSPVISQLLLLTWVGTEFLEIPLSKIISKYIKLGKYNISSFELFLAVFIYSDLKLPEYLKKIDDSLNVISNSYIAELYFLKLLLYYNFRANNLDATAYENTLKKIVKKAKNTTSKKAKLIVKQIKDTFDNNEISSTLEDSQDIIE